MIKRTTFASWCLVLMISLIWQHSHSAFAQSQPQAALAGKSVLVLHAFEASIPVNEVTDRGLRASLDSGGVSIRNQFFEYLDLARNPGPGHRKLTADLMRLRYGQRKIDMIITVYAEALQFLLTEGRDIFPDVPILTLYMSPGIELPKTNRRLIDHQVSYDMVGTLEIALKLVPAAKRVYVVGGVHCSEKKLQNQARKDFKKWEGQLEFTYLSDMPLEDVLTRVSSAPPGTIIFFLSMLVDSAGKIYTSRNAVGQVSRVSRAPVFGLYDILLGYGIAGGSIVSYERNGTRAGQLALDILSGTQAPADIPAVLDVPPIPMFDWRQLRHWNLSEGALPKGSIVINRGFTLWDVRYYIIGALAFCLVETALIIILIAQRRRKKVAEENLLRKTEELDQFFNISLDLMCIANTDGYFLHLNPAWERVLGYAREELMAKRFLDFVHPDDLDRTREAISTLTSQQQIFFFENRYRCKDGTYRWLQWSSAPAGKLIYAAARDVTEQKRAEEALWESEKEAKRIANEALAMAEIGRIIGSTLTIEEVYESFAAVAKRIIPFDRIVINMIDGEKGVVRNVYMAGGEIQDREVEKVYPLEGSGNAEMLRTKSTFLLQTEDFREYKDRFPMLLSTFEAGFRSIMNVPLFSKGEVIGGLLLRSLKPYAYMDKDVKLAERVGSHIAGAIGNAQLFLKEKQIEEALRESEDRFRQVAETVGDFIWEVDANGLYRYTSPSVEKILGYTPGELIGKKHFYDLFVPEVREELKTAAFKVFAAKEAFRAFPNPNVSKEGGVVHLETSGVPLLDADGNLVGYRGADTDITERKRAEAKIRKAAEEWQTTFDSISDMVMLLDREYKIVQINEASISFFKLPMDRVLGNHCYTLMHGTDKPVEICPLAKVMKTKRHEETELYDEERYAWFHVSVDPIFDDGGEITRVVHTVKDITDRKLAEGALEERFRFERLLSDLSGKFVNIPPDRVDSEIEYGLRQILEFFQVERCGLLQILPDKASWQITHVATVEDVPPVPLGVELPVSLHPWAYDKLIRKGEVVSFSRLDDLPAEANIDRQTWIEWGIRSNLIIPIIIGKPADCVVAINSVKTERVWPEELIPRLRLVGEIFASALERKQIRLQIEERLRFETLISNLSAGFVNLPPDEVDSEINKELRSITEFFDADRCTVGLFSEDGARLTGAYEYHSAETKPGPEFLSKEQMPWYFEQLIRGNRVVMNRVEDLPPEAEKERQVCLVRGMKSVLSIPMLSGRKTLGSCVLVSTRGERVWPEEYIPRLRLLVEILVNVLERKRAEEAFRESERILRQNENDLRRLAGRLISAQEEERSRLARELHDDLAQRLAVFAIGVGKLEEQLMDPPAPVQEELREMKKDVIKISQDVHSLSRQLHPSILDDLGLIKAVQSECMNFLRREGIEIVFNHENIPTVIPKDISLSLYRIIQEGLNNISKHACAEHISVSLKGIDHDVLLSVLDDGIGFDSAEVKEKPGLGLSSIRERVRLIHGELSIQSQPEKGTVITVRVPLTREGE